MQGLQHLQKIPPMETFDEKQTSEAISEGDEKAFKTFFLYYSSRNQVYQRTTAIARRGRRFIAGHLPYVMEQPLIPPYHQ